jgi:transcriptional regulator with GAF, ATPase, and Fis domain
MEKNSGFSDRDKKTVKEFSDLLSRLGFKPEIFIPFQIIRGALGDSVLTRSSDCDIIIPEINKDSHAFPTLGELERKHILHTLKLCDGECKTASRLLGINRSTLYRKMKKYGIEKKG